MPARIQPPLLKDFHLEETDQRMGVKEADGYTFVAFRQGSQGDYERRDELFSEIKRTLELDGTQTIVQRLSFHELTRLEVWLTISSCNIEDDNGTPLFKFSNGKISMTQAEFEKAWSKLPPYAANEIHQKCLEVNLMWSANGEAPLPLSEPQSKPENTTVPSEKPSSVSATK